MSERTWQRVHELATCRSGVLVGLLCGCGSGAVGVLPCRAPPRLSAGMGFGHMARFRRRAAWRTAAVPGYGAGRVRRRGGMDGGTTVRLDPGTAGGRTSAGTGNGNPAAIRAGTLSDRGAASSFLLSQPGSATSRHQRATSARRRGRLRRCAAAVAAVAAAAMPPRGERRFVPDEVITAFSSNATPQAIEQLARRYNLTQLETQSLPLIGTTFYRWRINGRRPVGDLVGAHRGRTHRRQRAAQLYFLAAGGRAKD